MRTKRNRALLALMVTLLLLAAGFAIMLPASAQGLDCKTFHNHGGHVPGRYDVAFFHEDEPEVNLGPIEVGDGIFVNPRDYDAGSRWDRVQKCVYVDTTTTTSTTLPPTTTTTVIVTTTTQPEVTTTTLPPSTTTTQPEETTTTVVETTTTTEQETTTTTVVSTTSTEPPDEPVCGDDDYVGEDCLPFTGLNLGLLPWALILFIGGGATVGLARRWRTE